MSTGAQPLFLFENDHSLIYCRTRFAAPSSREFISLGSPSNPPNATTGIEPMTKRTPPRGDQQADLFAANFADIPIRDQRDTMERPFFSLAKKHRYAPIEYSVGDVWVEVTANSKFGMATIWTPTS